MTGYSKLDISDIGTDATENDLAIFQAICAETNELKPELTESEITELVWGDGDFFANAKKIGVDVDAILAKYPEQSN